MDPGIDQIDIHGNFTWQYNDELDKAFVSKCKISFCKMHEFLQEAREAFRSALIGLLFPSVQNVNPLDLQRLKKQAINRSKELFNFTYPDDKRVGKNNATRNCLSAIINAIVVCGYTRRIHVYTCSCSSM